MSVKKSSWFQLEAFIDILLENRYCRLAMIIFVVLPPIGIIFGYIIIFWVVAFILLVAGSMIAVLQERGKLKLYRRDFIPIPIVINISNSADSKNALNQVFSIIEDDNQYTHHKENLDKIFHLKEDDLVFEFKGDIEDKEKLKDFLKIVRHDVEKLENKIPAKDEFYLIYIGPISVAILIGAIFATHAVMVFQYNKSANGYNKVYEIKDRKIKENVESFEKFNLEIIVANKADNSKKAVLAIDISSHKINLNQSKIKDYGDIFYLKAKNDKGTLSEDEDWGQYVREIFKELNELQRKYEEVKLVYSMPVSIGLMLGVAIQNYWKIILTQYGDGSYKDLLCVNEIKYYF